MYSIQYAQMVPRSPWPLPMTYTQQDASHNTMASQKLKLYYCTSER